MLLFCDTTHSSTFCYFFKVKGPRNPSSPSFASLIASLNFWTSWMCFLLLRMVTWGGGGLHDKTTFAPKHILQVSYEDYNKYSLNHRSEQHYIPINSWAGLLLSAGATLRTISSGLVKFSKPGCDIECVYLEDCYWCWWRRLDCRRSCFCMMVLLMTEDDWAGHEQVVSLAQRTRHQWSLQPKNAACQQPLIWRRRQCCSSNCPTFF